jgi:PAS domain S-box-containing protein
MGGERKTREQLVNELAEMRRRLDELEASDAKRRRADEALRKERDRAQRYLDIAEVMLVAINEMGNVALINRKGCKILGYNEEELVGKSWFDTCLPARIREDVRFIFQRLVDGEVEPVEYYENPVQTKSGEERIIAWHNTVVVDEGGDIVGTLSSGQDITERVRSEEERARAEEALRRHTDRLEILHEIDRGILAARSPGAIAQAALGRIRQLVPCRRASVAIFDHGTDQINVLAVNVNGKAMLAEGTSAPVQASFAKELQQGKVKVVEDILALSQLSPIEQALLEEGTRTYVNVPLIVQDRLIGSLNLGASSPKVLTAEHIDIACEVAAPLAIAIQQAGLHAQIQRHAEELEQRVVDRTRELSALYEVTAIANESLDLETTLARSLARVMEAMESVAGVIHLLDEGGERLCLAVQQGLPPSLVAQIESLPPNKGLEGWVIEHGQPLVVPGAPPDPRMVVTSGIVPRTFAGVPMRAGGRALGVLSVLREMEQPEFSEEEIALLASIADQVGGVVESARLRQLAEQAAVMDERRRLARDLHDSVTQSLYSLTLLAETGRRSAKAGDLEGVVDYLGRLGRVAQQALKEMRLLIYELRPLALERDGLAGAVQQRLDAVEGRAGVETRLLVEKDGQLAAPVEEALYRIAVEALNNTLKHAEARLVEVRIRVGDDHAELEVVDDGRGFDPQIVGDTGGMGLITMRERAERVGGTLTILSAPGEGTRVTVVVSSRQRASSGNSANG